MCAQREGLPAQVCLGAALGISKPQSLLWFKSDLFTYALGFLMLSMGLTLTFDDFRQVRRCCLWLSKAMLATADSVKAKGSVHRTSYRLRLSSDGLLQQSVSSLTLRLSAV